MREPPLWTVVALLIACQDPSSPLNSHSDSVWGGELVPEGEMTGVVWFAQAQCSATVVGDHLLLTAAHCAVESEGETVYLEASDVGGRQLIPRYQPGNTLGLYKTSTITPEAQEFPFTLERMIFPPDHLSACLADPECAAAPRWGTIKDIALLQVKEKLTDVFSGLPVDLTPLKLYDEIVHVGYGQLSLPYQKRRFGTVVGASLEKYLASDVFYTYTNASPTAALVQGDSGGPVLKRTNDVWAVVGVFTAAHFNELLINPQNLPGLSATRTGTIGNWLQQQGAHVTASDPCHGAQVPSGEAMVVAPDYFSLAPLSAPYYNTYSFILGGRQLNTDVMVRMPIYLHTASVADISVRADARYRMHWECLGGELFCDPLAQVSDPSCEGSRNSSMRIHCPNHAPISHLYLTLLADAALASSCAPLSVSVSGSTWRFVDGECQPGVTDYCHMPRPPCPWTEEELATCKSQSGQCHATTLAQCLEHETIPSSFEATLPSCGELARRKGKPVSHDKLLCLWDQSAIDAKGAPGSGWIRLDGPGAARTWDCLACIASD